MDMHLWLVVQFIYLLFEWGSVWTAYFRARMAVNFFICVFSWDFTLYKDSGPMANCPSYVNSLLHHLVTTGVDPNMSKHLVIKVFPEVFP